MYTASHKTYTEKGHRRIMSSNGNISPDGKWKVVFAPTHGIRWIQLTQTQEQFTIKEIVEATKNICPELWKK